jgi:putative ABC transport system ATP-binding protein
VTALLVEGLARHVGVRRRTVLEGLSLRVEPGGVAVVLGPSGSGKSTLLRCLAGLERFDAGRVALGTLEVAPGGQGVLLGRVGLVFQSVELFPHLRVLENCTLAPRLRGEPEGEREARSWLERLGLADRADAWPQSLSGGERQRVAIARAVVGERRLLLADEPTGALDSANGEQIVELLQGVRAQRGTTVLLVTNDPEVAARADRILRIRDGRAEDATPAGGRRSASG